MAKRPWWDGRCVAIRPDVPGAGFDPSALVLVDDSNRAEIYARIERAVAESKASPWPHWLADAPADLLDGDRG